jgi:hypothetical protein
MRNKKRALCILGAMLAIAIALVAPTAFAGCAGCDNGGQVFSAPVYAAPQILAAPVYQPQVFAAPQVVYQQRAVVAAAPVYAAPAAVVQKNVVVARAPRQRLFNFRSRSVQKNVVRGGAAAAVVY